MKNDHQFGPAMASILLAIFPLAMLNLHHAANFIYISLFLVCLLQFIPAFNLFPAIEKGYQKSSLWLMLSFGIYPCAILLHFLIVGHWSTAGFDAPSRFLMALPIIWVLCRFELTAIKWTYPAAIFGSWIALVEAGYQMLVMHEPKAMTYFTWPSNFGDLVVVLGILSMGFYGGKWWQKTLAISGLLAALISSYLSQSRGSWMAITASGAIFILLRYKSSISKAIKPFLLLVAVFLLLYFSVPKINTRINLGWYELTAPISKLSNTSVGLRRQFWQASMIMIKDHPLIGIGRLQFAKEKSTLIDRGILTSDADGYAHPHNEMLYAQVESGIFGLLGVLALYLGPLLYFIRALSNPDSQIQRAAVLGILIVVSYFVFGLVDVMLVAWVMEAPVYIVSILIPILIINSRKIGDSKPIA